MSRFWSNERATPSTTTMVFCSINSSGRVFMSNRPVTSNSRVSSFAIEISEAVLVVDRLADRADRLREALDRMMRRHVAGLEMHFGGAVIVARDEAVEDLGEEAPLLRRQPAHDAEVDRRDAALCIHEQISRMHVGVEEAIAQRVAQEGLHQRAPERRQIEPARFQRGAIGERRAVDPFEREHAARGALPVDRRHAEIRIVLGVLGDLRDCRGLEPQVHLDGHRARQRVDGLDQLSRRASAECRSAVRAAK